MGWCSATEIMDTALEAAERAITASWQLASGAEGARTPAFANALRAWPELRAELDDVLRPFVAKLAAKLVDADWDCVEESAYFDRFRQEMLGYDHREMAEWYRERLVDDWAPTAEMVREYSERLAFHLEQEKAGA